MADIDQVKTDKSRTFLFWPWLLAATGFGFFGKVAFVWIDMEKTPIAVMYALSLAYIFFPYAYITTFFIAIIIHRDTTNLLPKRPSLNSILSVVVAQIVLMGISNYLSALVFGSMLYRQYS